MPQGLLRKFNDATLSCVLSLVSPTDSKLNNYLHSTRVTFSVSPSCPFELFSEPLSLLPSSRAFLPGQDGSCAHTCSLEYSECPAPSALLLNFLAIPNHHAVGGVSRDGR